MTEPLRRCNYPGCMVLVREKHCQKHQGGLKQKPKAAEDRYGWRWEQASKQYRGENPLCVECLFIGRITPARLVDHIIPVRGRDVRLWDRNNWCSLCWAHHNRKTQQEQDIPRFVCGDRRLVVCGLPATGKSTLAKSLAAEWNCEYWDWDEVGAGLGLPEVADMTQADMDTINYYRGQWIGNHRSGPAVMIVSRPLSAMTIAAAMDASVHHCTCTEAQRGKRIAERMKNADAFRIAHEARRR